jgi:hypothetical protein
MGPALVSPALFMCVFWPGGVPYCFFRRQLSDLNDLLKKKFFRRMDLDGSWSSCLVADNGEAFDEAWSKFLFNLDKLLELKSFGGTASFKSYKLARDTRAWAGHRQERHEWCLS